MTRIHLKKGREDSLLRRHPWLFSGAISHIEGEPYEGDIVSIISRSGECLGYGPVHTAESLRQEAPKERQALHIQ